MREQLVVAFVRAVMHGRDGLHRTVQLGLFTNAGATESTSYLTTGNVSFRCPEDRLPELQRAVETGLEAVVGRRTEVFLRSVDELTAIQAGEPFADPPLTTEHERLVTFLAAPPPADLDLPIIQGDGEVVVFAAGRRELFSVARKSDGSSRGPGGFIERALDARVTTRAWSTVERILTRLT